MPPPTRSRPLRPSQAPPSTADAAAARHGGRVDRELVALLQAGAALHDEAHGAPLASPATEAGPGRGLRRQDHAVLARRLSLLASRRADDAHDEQVEEHEERDLE